MVFEILCLDNEEKVQSRTIKTFMYALMSNDELFEDPQMDEKGGSIVDKQNTIEIIVQQFPTDKIFTSERNSVAFIVKLISDNIDIIDKKRLILVDHAQTLGFSNIRILLDEVSARLASELYPQLYELENKVRTFIVNFFIKKLGVNLAKLALPTETIMKIKNRKDNDKIFISQKIIERDVSLIAFYDLGAKLYR